eukprot:CAMPEP_0167815304 /NCGR_PEP_ID=MMETSP0112_2-20121227/2937_1 /TAXON_ID=91324 /ORGANISM="Lotharella globosa, Strain CCCM811" /LENGTH=201 /DNA_ID=CAMNT_0007714687 /DNA_START=301 /DNA_END=906 /DNA_ORIENTATION=-
MHHLRGDRRRTSNKLQGGKINDQSLHSLPHMWKRLRKAHARVIVVVVGDSLNGLGVDGPDSGENTSKDEEETGVVNTERNTSTITVQALVNKSLGRGGMESSGRAKSSGTHGAGEVALHGLNVVLLSEGCHAAGAHCNRGNNSSVLLGTDGGSEVVAQHRRAQGNDKDGVESKGTDEEGLALHHYSGSAVSCWVWVPESGG